MGSEVRGPGRFRRWARDWNPMTTRKPRRFYRVWAIFCVLSTVWILRVGVFHGFPLWMAWITGIGAGCCVLVAELFPWEELLRKERFFRRDGES